MKVFGFFARNLSHEIPRAHYNICYSIGLETCLFGILSRVLLLCVEALKTCGHFKASFGANLLKML
jgi:hypothetical protein